MTLALLLILLLAGTLRVYDLGGESLWLDEAVSIDAARQSVSDILSVVPRRYTNAPIYYLMLHGWIRLVGDSAIAVRVPSAIFGIAAVAVLFLVGLELRGAALGLVVAFLSAISYFLIRYAQEARTYSLLVLLGSVSYYFFIRMVRRGETGGAAVGYAASTALLFYAHYHAAFLVLAQLCTVACFWRRLEKVRFRWLAALALAALTFSPWLSTLWVQIQMVTRSWWIPVPTIQSFERLNSQWVSAPYDYTVGPIAFPPYTLTGLFLVLVFMGCFIWARALASTSGTHWFRPRGCVPAEETVLLALWLLVPVLASYTFSRIGPFSIFLPRYLIGALPALYLLVARGVVALNRRWLAGGLCLVILVLTMPGLLHYYRYPQKEQWDHVARLVERGGRPRDIVVLTHSSPNALLPFKYYYHGSLDRIRVYHWDLAKVAKRLRSAMVGHRRLWLIVGHSPNETALRALSALLPQGPIARHRFVRVKVLLYKIPPYLREGR